jgi:hypothetical protein
MLGRGMVNVMHLQSEGEAQQSTGGDHSMHDDAIIGDLCAGALVDIDGEVDWGCCQHVDTPSVLPSLVERPSCGQFGSFDAAEQDDQVLDGWLASLTSDDFERIFDGLVDLLDPRLSDLKPTA